MLITFRNILNFAQTQSGIAAEIPEDYILALYALMLVVGLITFIISGICLMRLLQKSGYHSPWHAWVPILGSWRLFELAGKPGWWTLAAIGAAIPAIGIIFMVASVVLSILMYISLAKSFGKSTGFAVGLVFLTIPFLLVLAFDKSTYIGPEGKGLSVGGNATPSPSNYPTIDSQDNTPSQDSSSNNLPA